MSDGSKRLFTAKDLREAAGVSYRQLNQWEEKGVLPPLRGEGRRSWRKFTPREVFALMVCAELRDRFNVPLDGLRFVLRFMLQGGAHHLRAAVEMIADWGVSVFILTDCKDTFTMDTDIEFADLLRHGAFGGDQGDAYVFLKVNPIVNRLLSMLDEDFHLPNHRDGYRMMSEVRNAGTARSNEELEVLRAIRDGRYKRIEIVLADGTVRQLVMEESVEPGNLDAIAEALDFGKLEVVRKDGKTMSVKTTRSVKPSS